MKTLNLVNPDNSDIKYKKILFPDGQQNIVITSTIDTFNIRNTSKRIKLKEPIQIKSRLNNWLDLELITCAVASLRELGVEEIHLYTPYIMGARSDRKFEEGGNNYLKDVICPIINSLGFKTVTCIDPHSDVLEACIKGFRKKTNLELIKNFFIHIYPNKELSNVADKDGNIEMFGNRFTLVSPDAGASKKIYKLAEQIGYKGDIITCSKDRDENGKLTKTVVPYQVTHSNANKDIIIIDDICDGGATFINISKELKGKTLGKIYLIVTHGIFSKGFYELAIYFDGIYCTNSYKDIKHNDVFKDVNTYSGSKNFIKQLNVF